MHFQGRHFNEQSRCELELKVDHVQKSPRTCGSTTRPKKLLQIDKLDIRTLQEATDGR
jgi:hypothetical protein